MPLPIPTKDEIALLPPFSGLPLKSIFLVANARHAELAKAELMAAGVVGFDTESKPIFRKGQKSEGPHVLQFATAEKAFIFQSDQVETQPVIIELLKAVELTKIGFDLKGDLRQISDRFNVRPGGLVDLDATFRRMGYRHSIGAKTAIAMLFQRKLTKSKSLTTSNWAAAELSDRQLEYAANDAYAAILVHQALQSGGSPAR